MLEKNPDGTPKTVEQWAGELRKTRPHWFTDYAPPSEETLMQELISDATTGRDGNGPTLKARGKLLAQVGERRYLEILAQHGCSPNNLKPGTTPEDREAQEKADEGKRAAAKSNPWSREGWNITRQGEIVRSMGLEKAQQIARAANSRIGATRPT